MRTIIFRCPGACCARIELAVSSLSEAWYRAEQHGWTITGANATCRSCGASGGAR